MSARAASTIYRPCHKTGHSLPPPWPISSLSRLRDVATPRTRPVRLGDSSPGGRLRFDGLARYLQDVSNDDTRDAAFENDMAWVVRRTAIEVRSGARFGEELTLTTFASGGGPQLG